uniref:Nucleolin 1 n=1 Tax=Noccaea caerulescens TaxID=107243 RepID=A0A1J3D3W4_NOCCA
MDKYSSKRSDAKGERFKFKLLEGDVDPAMEVYMKPRVRISVEGYDTRLPEEDIKKALVDLFESCGEIIRVTVPIDPRTRLVERRAFIILRGDGAEEKALQLDGSDVGGLSVFVKVTPEDNEETVRFQLDLLKEVTHDPRYRFGVAVCGFDASLPYVKSTLENHFSSCGDITCLLIKRMSSEALIYFTQEEAEGKALKLNGSLVGGAKVTVRLAATVGRGRSPSPSHASEPVIDYCIPCHIVFLSQEINEKIMAFKKKKGLV